ncbi:hypothetical protein GGR52DRAFT_151757 [Hypoxylon sp. FL1284]|nr:hypothetical protein GGR52DRAFT_151757 [Hypoxylon sp. FL1284]
MRQMKEKYSFEPTPKQYRFCFEKWRWTKYSQKRYLTPGFRSSSPSTVSSGNSPAETAMVGSSVTSLEDSDRECDYAITPRSFDSEGASSVRALSQIRRQFLSVFSEDCCPIPQYVRELRPRDLTNGEDCTRRKDAAITAFIRSASLNGDSVDVVTYHHLNYVLANSGPLGRGSEDEEPEYFDDEPAIAKFRIIEQRQWYYAFDKNSSASRCVSSCLDWIKQQLTARPTRQAALSHFDALERREAGGDPDSSKQDVCLFVYLADALLDDWASQAAQHLDPGDRWDSLAEVAVGISPMETLRTMSSLILGTACLDMPSRPQPQRRSTRNMRRQCGADVDQLIDSALRGIEAIQEACDKRTQILEFVTEFVWIHEPSRHLHEKSSFEEEARRAAEAYVDAKLAASSNIGALDDASEISLHISNLKT